MKILILPALLLPIALAAQSVGPIYFDSASDYDSNFKENASLDGINYDPAGYLTLQGSSTGIAVYDSSTFGGNSGDGGTGGYDDDNQFDAFTASATVASSNYYAPSFRIGFLLRLDDSEANGYLVQVTPSSDYAVVFEIYEGASLTESGTRIYRQSVSLNSLTLQTDTFYSFKVSIDGGTFIMDFASGEATASHTDNSVSANSGQVGLLLGTQNPIIKTHLDNFQITPSSLPNNPPSDISLSSTNVYENEPKVTAVGTLSSHDPDIQSTSFTYSLVSGTGSTGNGLFLISGNTLNTNQSFNYEAQSAYSVRIRSTDEEGNYRDEAFTISIIDKVESDHQISEFQLIENDHLQLKWPLHAGYSYQLQESATLEQDSWTDRGAPYIAEDGESTLIYNIYLDETTPASRFFQVERTELP